MYVLNRTEKKFFSVVIFAIVFNLTLLHWTSIYVGSTPWLILCFALTVLYVPLTLISRWGIGAYPFIFLVLEELRNRFPFGGFGWGRIAYSQADAPFASIARFGGAAALSASVLLLGLFLFRLTQHRMQLWVIFPLFPTQLFIVYHTNF